MNQVQEYYSRLKTTLRPSRYATATAIKPMARDEPTLTDYKPSPDRERDFALVAMAVADTERFVEEEMRRSPNVMERLRQL